MEGESSETLVFEPVTDLDQGQYRCRSTFPTVGQFVYGGVTSSSEVTLTVHREYYWRCVLIVFMRNNLAYNK